MTNIKDSAEMSRMLKALASPVRLQILWLLRRTEFTGLQELVAEIPGASASNVCEQIQHLIKIGLVKRARINKRVCYTIEPRALRHLFGLLDSFSRKVDPEFYR